MPTIADPPPVDGKPAGANATRYAVYGALFGAAFPIFATLFNAATKLGSIGLVWQAQASDSLLWIIDTAPLFLGAFAWMAGRRQDRVEALMTTVDAAYKVLAGTYSDLEKTNRALEQTNAALAESSRLKSQFLANMSHELRTPLNAIIGFSRIVLKKTEGLIPEKQAKNLQTVHDSGKHLLSMVNDLLDIERIEAGMFRVNREVVDVGAMLSDVVTGLQPAATDKGLGLEWTAPPSPLRLRTDAVRLRQVLDNLVNNAIKYSDAGTIRIVVELRPKDGPEELRLHVVDQGLGIPEEHVAKIFDAFHQVDGSSTRAQGGVGLGLHLVRRLVELLDGGVSVKSKVGEGSTFTVTFPVSLLESGGPEPLATDGVTPKALEPAGEGPLVLVIDDQQQAAEILRAELVEAGFRVECALSGEEGLARAERQRPAVILLDMVMPGLDGWAVLRRLRADPELSATPVIITSMLDDTPKAWDLGIVGWLTKPVSPEDFLSVFRRIGIGTAADVLVVEDDPATRTMLVEQLGEIGLQPRAADDGPAAIAAINARLPEVVVLDLMLPQLDGFAVFDHLRARENGKDVPVVVYTAMDLTPEDRQRLHGGVMSLIQKGGGDVHDVIACVRRAIGRQGGKPTSKPGAA